MPEKILQPWPEFDPPDSDAARPTHKVINPPAASGVRRKKVYELPIKKSVKDLPPESLIKMSAGPDTYPVRGDRNRPGIRKQVSQGIRNFLDKLALIRTILVEKISPQILQQFLETF